MTRARKIAATVSLLSTAGSIGWLAVHSGPIESGLLGFAGLIGLAAVGLGQRSPTVQIFSRGVAWLVALPSVLTVALALAWGTSPDPMVVALAAGSISALALARPMLETEEARAQFSPVAFRKTLLTASTSAAAGAVATGALAVEAMSWRPGVGVALAAIAAGHAGSALGVLRMRAWGILLAAATSVAALLGAAVEHSEVSFAFLLASLPGLLFVLPVLLARLGAGSGARTASESHEATFAAVRVAPRVRVAVDDADEAPLAEEDAAPAPALRRGSISIRLRACCRSGGPSP